MNIDVHILLSFVSMLFSIHMLGMQIKEKNPVYNAVCMHDPAELASLFLSSPCMGLKYINIPDNNGQTALHRAVITGQGVIVKILLSNGADCNKKDTLKRTPLHHAVISRNIEIVELLLLRGASIHHRDRATRTPLYYAETFKCPEIVNMMSHCR